MTRPKAKCCIGPSPCANFFKPEGADSDCTEISLLPEEFEAIRLYDFNGLDQTAAAKIMTISQPTFARLISSARKKIADALVNGYPIRILSEKK